jgi:hypothetical protein
MQSNPFALALDGGIVPPLLWTGGLWAAYGTELQLDAHPGSHPR